MIWHVQRKRNQEKREKRKSTKNSNREQQTEERNIERSIENRGRKIHGDKLEKSDVATATRALRENALEARKPARAACALKRVSACGPIGLSASSALVENQKRIKK